MWWAQDGVGEGGTDISIYISPESCHVELYMCDMEWWWLLVLLNRFWESTCNGHRDPLLTNHVITIDFSLETMHKEQNNIQVVQLWVRFHALFLPLLYIYINIYIYNIYDISVGGLDGWMAEWGKNEIFDNHNLKWTHMVDNQRLRGTVYTGVGSNTHMLWDWSSWHTTLYPVNLDLPLAHRALPNQALKGNSVSASHHLLQREVSPVVVWPLPQIFEEVHHHSFVREDYDFLPCVVEVLVQHSRLAQCLPTACVVVSERTTLSYPSSRGCVLWSCHMVFGVVLWPLNSKLPIRSTFSKKSFRQVCCRIPASFRLVWPSSIHTAAGKVEADKQF